MSVDEGDDVGLAEGVFFADAIVVFFGGMESAAGESHRGVAGGHVEAGGEGALFDEVDGALALGLELENAGLDFGEVGFAEVFFEEGKGEAYADGPFVLGAAGRGGGVFEDALSGGAECDLGAFVAAVALGEADAFSAEVEVE